jgi:ABC-type uncharacterized transport system ATPase subunit
MEKNETATRKEQLEWMRLNAEKDRVVKYKNIATANTRSYYTIMDQITKMLDLRKEVTPQMQATSSSNMM